MLKIIWIWICEYVANNPGVLWPCPSPGALVSRVVNTVTVSIIQLEILKNLTCPFISAIFSCCYGNILVTMATCMFPWLRARFHWAWVVNTRDRIISQVLDYIELEDLWVMGIYGDLFSPGPFIINPCLDLWGFISPWATHKSPLIPINLIGFMGIYITRILSMNPLPW